MFPGNHIDLEYEVQIGRSTLIKRISADPSRLVATVAIWLLVVKRLKIGYLTVTKPLSDDFETEMQRLLFSKKQPLSDHN